MPNCFHAFCTSNSRKKDSSVKFVCFPKPWVDKKRAKRWIQLCGRKNLSLDQISKNTYLCSKHFHPNVNLDWKYNHSLEPFHYNKPVPSPPSVFPPNASLKERLRQKDSKDRQGDNESRMSSQHKVPVPEEILQCWKKEMRDFKYVTCPRKYCLLKLNSILGARYHYSVVCKGDTDTMKRSSHALGCKLCPGKFPSYSNLIVHMNRCHPAETKVSHKDWIAQFKAEGVVTCPRLSCSRSFVEFKEVNQHFLECDGTISPSIRARNCLFCHKLFSLEDLNKHIGKCFEDPKNCVPLNNYDNLIETISPEEENDPLSISEEDQGFIKEDDCDPHDVINTSMKKEVTDEYDDNTGDEEQQQPSAAALGCNIKIKGVTNDLICVKRKRLHSESQIESQQKSEEIVEMAEEMRLLVNKQIMMESRKISHIRPKGRPRKNYAKEISPIPVDLKTVPELGKYGKSYIRTTKLDSKNNKSDNEESEEDLTDPSFLCKMEFREEEKPTTEALYCNVETIRDTDDLPCVKKKQVNSESLCKIEFSGEKPQHPTALHCNMATTEKTDDLPCVKKKQLNSESLCKIEFSGEKAQQPTAVALHCNMATTEITDDLPCGNNNLSNLDSLCKIELNGEEQQPSITAALYDNIENKGEIDTLCVKRKRLISDSKIESQPISGEMFEASDEEMGLLVNKQIMEESRKISHIRPKGRPRKDYAKEKGPITFQVIPEPKKYGKSYARSAKFDNKNSKCDIEETGEESTDPSLLNKLEFSEGTAEPSTSKY